MLKDLSRTQSRSLSQLSLTKCFGHFHTPSTHGKPHQGNSKLDRRYLKIEELRNIFRSTHTQHKENTRESKKQKKHIKGRAQMPNLQGKQAEKLKLVWPQSQGRTPIIPERFEKLAESAENTPFGSIHKPLVPIHQSQHQSGTISKELLTRIKCERRKKSIPDMEE